MRLFDRVADLPLTVESVSRDRFESDTSSGFLRKTTVFSLAGDGAVGRGEDVTYDTEDHDALADAPEDAFDLAGSYDSFADFSAALDGVDLFPTKVPERETAEHYRRWALESAGLDLALRQAGTDLASAVDRERAPLRFVVSTRLGDPPSADRVEMLLDRDPDCEFKLDPTTDWHDELVSSLAAHDRVRILDLKGQYEGTDVDQAPDPELYERILSGFPDAVVEDPAFTDETRPLFDGHEGRVSWDAPITGVESVESLPFEPSWLNIKPSRFGTVESLFDTIEYADERGMSLYGGGQFELDVGRDHIQLLASVFYPDGPNDVAPGEYNLPEPPAGLPTSPLEPGDDPSGLEF
ncbi:enolase [Haloferax gibbonsii]|uniref:Enolase superfamily enzyme related to L-alanine-DL-glutamate epimerase n=1 Tax=Haloferax gibbonsii TaxID=35746 RepID=A0A0K1IVK9_HALGI|nr:enolase [Haloferax gibbonsii]AKU08350.1 enolase superfamily enzyme related to L-alanine-DL-glutamate epimerase [Haloferax gibbonsii]